jgi:hypothetical protein
MRRTSEPRSLKLAVLAVALLVGAFVGAGGALAQAPAERRTYDIPAQPLTDALAAFATVSGVDIAYRQSLSSGRRSSPLNDDFSAPEALRRLLHGTGLAARFTGPRAAIVYSPGAPDAVAPRRGNADIPSLRLDMAEVRASIMIGVGDHDAHYRYAAAVQDEIGEILRSEGGYQGRSLRIEIRVAIDPAGVIREIGLRRPSSEPEWDRRVIAALTGRSLSRPPPENLSEPLNFEVETDRLTPNRRGGR